jgi:hypothetical protein
MRRWTVRRKLIVILMVTSGAAVTLASGAALVDDSGRTREAMRDDLSSLADVAGANSVAAMTFGDVKASQEILAALGLKPGVVAAALYDKSGRLFTSFRGNGASAEKLPIVANANASQITSDRITVVRPIELSTCQRSIEDSCTMSRPSQSFSSAR